LLKAVKFNVDRQAEDVALFEIGHVFALPSPPGITPDETERVAVIVAPAAGPDGGMDGAGATTTAAAAAVQTWQYLADALRLDAPSVAAARVPGLHPTRAALLTGRDGRSLGAVGEVDPDVVVAYGLRQRLGYLTLSVDALLAEPRRPWQAHEVSRFPASDIDLAFVVPDAVPAQAVQSTLATAAGSLVERVTLFDVYRSDQVGAGRRSLAFRLRFRAPDRTLDEAALAAVRQQAIDAVVGSHGATLRS
jgi:phenylalanyl-tRNA synthetase beta chain